MVGWHHRLNGHEFEQTPGDGEGPGSLVSMGSQKVGHNLRAEQQQRVGGLLLAAPTSDSKFMATAVIQNLWPQSGCILWEVMGIVWKNKTED